MPSPTLPPLDTLLQVYATARRAAAMASALAASYKPSDVARERKLDKTWVTEADSEIETVLRAEILRHHPDHAILGEEQGGQLSPKPDGFSWILDPIDGTFSFIHGIPFYSSLIAVLYGNTPVIGFACLPGQNITMSAIKGGGVFVNGSPWTKPTTLGNAAIEVVATADPYRFLMEGRQQQLQSLYTSGSFKCRTYPDALGYWMLLNGHVRAFVDPKVEVWDVAPFHVILPEAGFAIHPWEGGGLKRGSSVAYPLHRGTPLACQDVLAVLRG